jgi:thymidine kinase
MFNNDAVNHTLGRFQVCIGPMGSGKTSRVIGFALNNEKRLKDVAQKKSVSILMVRPSRDERIADQYIFTTHGNHLHYDVREHENVDVVVLGYNHEFELSLKYRGYDIYIFDEGQFFEIGIAKILSQLAFDGKEIFFTALLHDFKDEIFTTTQTVMSLPEVSNIKKLYNQCSLCGKNGFHSARMLNGKIVEAGPQIIIGGMEDEPDKYIYIGICTYCKKNALCKI